MHSSAAAAALKRLVYIMLKKLIASVSMLAAANGSVAATGLYSPYAEPHVNGLYNLLFCDDPSLFRNQAVEKNKGVWRVLLSENPDKSALMKLAGDERNEGRVRALAYNRLRLAGEPVPPKKLLGVIVELPLERGLDVLAAFSDGGVRYLNQSGKVAIFDGEDSPVGRLAKDVLSASQPIVDRIGPWDKQRLAPPKAGNVRLTFLVSDGLYFGEGPYPMMQKDAMAGPVLSTAVQLLLKVTEVGMRRSEKTERMKAD
jgi:hypothetical protein